MSKIQHFFFTVIVLLLASCSKEYDDSSLVNRVDDLENRVTKLEQLCQQMNTNISSVQSIVDAIQKNDHFSSVTPITKDNQNIGYTITFASGKSITIYHGKDGQNGENGSNGYTPKIGVKQDTDNVYYWTIDNEWLTDDQGNKIKASPDNGSNGQDGSDGQDGANGQDGKTPQLKIENDYWYVSYDNGTSWTQLGKATGKDGVNGMNGLNGDSFFKDVNVDDKYIYFTLANGTTLTIEKMAELALYFDTSTLNEVATNSEVRVEYTVVSESNSVQLEVIATSDLTAEVVATDASNKSGYILIRTSKSYDAASKVIVFATDGNKVVMKSIKLQVTPDTESAQLYIYNGATKNVSAAGGAVTLSFLTNVDCEAVIPDEASSWISNSQNRALNNENITLYVAENTSDRRSAKVKVQSLDGKLSVEYTIVQAGKASSSNPEVDDYGNILDTPASNEIFYTSKNGQIVNPNDPNAFGATIISNTYANGIGIILFDRSVTSIGNNAFQGNSLTNISIPNSVTTIGKFAFYCCSNLTNISLANSVTSIGQGAFYSCSNLTNINIPNSVTIIGYAAFENCSSLTNINIPNSLTEIGGYAFKNCIGLTNINIPNSVTEIGNGAFENCSSLTNINIPNSMTIIKTEAFKNCSGITNINIPNSVTIIESYAFTKCISLESVVIGTGIKNIYNNAFENCYALNSITCKATTPPTGGSKMFEAIGNSPKIYVPTGSGDAYKAKEYWSDYASIIVEKDM